MRKTWYLKITRSWSCDIEKRCGGLQSVWGGACIAIFVRSNVSFKPLQWGHFGWSCLLQRIAWRLRLRLGTREWIRPMRVLTSIERQTCACVCLEMTKDRAAKILWNQKQHFITRSWSVRMCVADTHWLMHTHTLSAFPRCDPVTGASHSHIPD